MSVRLFLLRVRQYCSNAGFGTYMRNEFGTYMRNEFSL